MLKYLSSSLFQSRVVVRTSCRSLTTLQVDKKSSSQIQVKTPKGTRDYNEKEMTIRNQLFNTITKVFQRHGASTIDTPVFEMRDILSGKYGEDSKLIYDLANQGGEDYSLRYDLTVPFARYLAMHHTKKEAVQMKRYQLAKVYRRDQPIMTKGRLREFMQCDFDIAGTYDTMIPDAEVLKVLCETLDAVEVEHTVKLNHRKILDGIFVVCGVKPHQIRSVSSAVDKLDKLSWTDVKKEMMEEKNIPEYQCDLIGSYVNQFKKATTKDVLDFLDQDDRLKQHQGASQGIQEVKLLLDYLNIFEIKDRIQLDLSLARGLDYYTGIIYEAIQHESSGVGSIAAGGRYDSLVGMFSPLNKHGKPKTTIPCVGVSIGVERLFSILMARHNLDDIKNNATQVYVISVGDGLLKERMHIANQLWKHGVPTSFQFKNKPKLDKQWQMCEKDKIPFAIIIGQEEIDTNTIRIKDMRTKDAQQQGGHLFNREDMIKVIKNKISEL